MASNIAIFIDSLGGGGAESVMLTLARGMSQQGHNVHFFLLEPRIEYKPESNISVHVLYQGLSHRKSTKWPRINKTANDMISLVKNVESDIGTFSLHLVNLDPSSKVIAKCHFKNTYFVLHNAMAQELKREAKLGPIKYLRKRLAKNVYNHKDIIAVSKGVAEEALSNKLITPNSVKQIYNPVDFEKIRELARINDSEIPSCDYLIHAGRVVKQKRHDVLFQALSQVPDIKLVLLCKYVDKAKSLAKKYNVQDRIITPGFQGNPYNWIKNAKALVSSSDFEGLGMNLIDSLICDTPVVSTDCDYGPREILLNQQSTFLVPTNSPTELAEKIKLVLTSPPKIDISELEHAFSIDHVVSNYLSLIKQ